MLLLWLQNTFAKRSDQMVIVLSSVHMWKIIFFFGSYINFFLSPLQLCSRMARMMMRMMRGMKT